jgi:hypothetical protein
MYLVRKIELVFHSNDFFLAYSIIPFSATGVLFLIKQQAAKLLAATIN